MANFEKALSDPIVEINNNIVSFKGNSLVVKTGKAERTIRSQGVGGRSVSIFAAENVESRISLFKGTLITTNNNIKLYYEWDEAGLGGILIRLSEKLTDFSMVFRKMTLTNQAELSIGSDGEFEVEFQGPPIV